MCENLQSPCACVDFRCKKVVVCVREKWPTFSTTLHELRVCSSHPSSALFAASWSLFLNVRRPVEHPVCPPRNESQSKILNISEYVYIQTWITAIFTSYLFLQLLIAFLNRGFKPLSSQFLCSAGFLERFFVLCCLQRGDAAFQIINLHLLLGQGSLQSLEKTAHP